MVIFHIDELTKICYIINVNKKETTMRKLYRVTYHFKNLNNRKIEKNIMIGGETIPKVKEFITNFHKQMGETQKIVFDSVKVV